MQKARPVITTKQKVMAQAVAKASSVSASNTVRLGPVGYNGLNTIRGQILENSKADLRYPRAIKTYKEMSMDSAIFAANNAIDIAIGKVKWHFEAPEGNDKPEVKAAVDFLNYCMNNMENQTFNDFINEVGSYRTFGYHVAEKVYTRAKKGRFAGRLKWKKLSTRSQDTIHRWLFSKNNEDLIGLEQDTRQLNQSGNSSTNIKPKITIDKKKFMLFRYNPKRDNPEGSSPLIGCYIPWNYKKVVEEYEGIGVAKDLGGIPVFGVPVEFLNKAAADSTSEQAQVIEVMQKQAASLHAGDQNFLIKPIAYNDSGKELFSFELQGIDGGGKQYNTQDIINRKTNEILMVFLADVLKLGSDAHGSFALAENKNNLLAHAIEHHLELMARVIQNDLIPQTLAINGWLFEDEDMPVLKYSDIEDRDLDELGKFVQRVVSAGALEVDQGLSDDLRDKARLAPVDRDKPIAEDMKPAATSRAGDGMATAGEGTSTSVGGSDSSTANTENA